MSLHRFQEIASSKSCLCFCSSAAVLLICYRLFSLDCGHKTWPVIQIYLPGMAFSHDKPFEMLHELFVLAGTPGGQLWLG